LRVTAGIWWSLTSTCPGGDGIEVIISCKRSQADTPIISTSAYSATVYREGALRGGANDVLVKPINPEELIRTARGLLKLQRAAETKSKTILAIGAFPGDVDAGCGGTLMKYALRGDKTHVLVLSLGAPGSDGDDRILATQRACKIMGAEAHLPSDDALEIPDLDRALLSVQDALSNLNPEIIFAPSLNDVRESRKHAHTAAEIAAKDPASLLCYQAATTTLDFRPSLFEDISDFLDQKMAALTHYLPQVQGRPHLDPELSRAAARYWGRFLGYGEVEPFEVTRHTL
jgi:LmbE family N-acetylglucosaminyl deacetylase